ncbi:MAG TPA: Fic family protein, partial [Blastocatellia bacterium]|nr:Fic family protein [Blastocatellia bacterium]
MQRPPDRKSPNVLFTRSINEWINQVTQKHKQFADLQLSAEEKADVERYVETEFIYSTLKLEDDDYTREQIARIISQGAGATGEKDLPAFALLTAIRRIKELVKTDGRAARLTIELLIELNNQVGRGSGFRTTADDRTLSSKPVPVEHLPAIIENACQWYTAESFDELNPIEQASIVFLRLMEIQPFERANLQTALAAASLFTLRSTLPPVIIKPERKSAFLNAIEESRRTNTKPMVELMADAAQVTIGEMIDKGKGRKG